MAEPADPSLTPEKRLLDLIEEPETLKKEVAAGAKKGRRGGLFSPGDLKGMLASFNAGVTQWVERHKAAFGIKQLNRTLKFIVMILALFLTVDFIWGYVGVQQDFSKKITIPENKIFDVPEPKEMSKEGEPVESWDLGKIFMPYGKRQEEAERLQKEQSSRLVEITKNLKLTGISFNPTEPKRAYCMIEDVEKNITTFLREGDPLGVLRVLKIHEDHVVLESGNETVELN
ncbi:MAG TPA: hypothetical protein PLO78_04895 [Candidatus Omnitrophota bacterium]|nr:hypothetical protein [Candidatus Omnitrophota bacterium]